MSPSEQSGDRLLVVFDGQCGMCNRLVRWLLRHDAQGRLRFASSDHPAAAVLLNRHGLAADTTRKTILAVRNFAEPGEEVMSRSAAIAAVLQTLPVPWPLAGLVLKCFPAPLRDLGYRIVAHSRYRIWGRPQSCPLPSAAEQSRFI